MVVTQIFQMALAAVEHGRVPDTVVRAGIRRLLRQRLVEGLSGGCEAQQERLQSFIEECRQSTVALVPEKANEQHYEVPAEFFARVLGKHLKYSCCHWPDGVTSLDDAESAALNETCRRADIADGQRVLDLGCGWGSFSLYAAENFPKAEFTAVSNSAPQRKFIESVIAERGLVNLHVLTADMNSFDAPATFDRVVSVEMFEHMRNHEELLRRIRGWLNPGGKLFVHIFCHRQLAYPFETEGAGNWMGRYFFSGGMMPSDDLLVRYQHVLPLERQWRWSGTHYEKTCNAWLAKMDAQRDDILQLFREAYGPSDAKMWFMRWRMFFMACAELFAYEKGQQWWVSHYRFARPEKG